MPRSTMGWYWSALRRYAVFGGRARRREFWIFALVSAFLGWLLATVEMVLDPGSNAGVGPVTLGFWALTLVPALAVATRRLHDAGRSGRWLALLAIPVLGWAALAVLWAQESEVGPNRHGPDPKARPGEGGSARPDAGASGGGPVGPTGSGEPDAPAAGGTAPPRGSDVAEPPGAAQGDVPAATAAADGLALYGRLAGWWPLLSAPADYEEEAAFYAARLRGACDGRAASLLELGCGGGNNASHMKGTFESVTLVDRSEEMLLVSRRLNPECSHVAADMRSVRLGRTFDCVFVHDAIDYMLTADDLRRAFETAFVHCRPGGAALFAPDHVRETFRPSTTHGGHDAGERGLRYLLWLRDPDPDDARCTTDFAFLLRDGDEVRVESDRHEHGLFARTQWLEWLAGAGFQAEVLSFPHSELDRPLEVFLAKRPGD